MNNIVKAEHSNQLSVDEQIEQKKLELSTVLQTTILEQYAYDFNSHNPESVKKKQEVAKFISQLINTKDKTGRPAILSCTVESIKDCCITYCNNELNFFRNQAYLFPYGNKLSFMIGKDGYVAMAKQLNPEIEDFYYDVVYKKDEFEYSKIAGKTVITKHNQKIENITCQIPDIACAYATCVYKNGSHEADIMTIQEILNALKTAQKGGFSDTHKLNPKIMLSKFPLRRLAKRKINQLANEEIRRNIVFEDDDKISVEQNNIDLSFEIDETQDFSDIEQETVSEMESVAEVEQEGNEDVKTVSYSEWLDIYKSSGEWEQVKGTYDSTNKTVQIRRV